MKKLYTKICFQKLEKKDGWKVRVCILLIFKTENFLHQTTECMNQHFGTNHTTKHKCRSTNLYGFYNSTNYCNVYGNFSAAQTPMSFFQFFDVLSSYSVYSQRVLCWNVLGKYLYFVSGDSNLDFVKCPYFNTVDFRTKTA